MADNVIQVILRARDEASAALKNVARELGFVSAQHGVLSTATDAGTAALSRFSPAAGAVARSLSPMIVEATAAATAASLLPEELKKLTDVGGIAAQSLVPIAAAASTAGVSATELASALSILPTSLKAAQTGAGEAYKALKDLGLTTTTIRAGFASTGEAIAAIAPRLARVKDEAKQAEIATTLFGASGAKLVPALGAMEGAAAGAASGLGAIVAVAAPVIAALVAVTGAVIAANAALSAAKEGGEFADRIGDIAERTGLTVAEVSRLNYVATQSDASIGQLTGTFRALATNLKEARDETSEQRATFEALGFSAEELDRGLVGPKDAIERLADAVKATNNPMERLALTTAVLGRGAADLVPFLSLGSDGIRELEAEAERLNLVLREAAVAAGDEYSKAILKADLANKVFKSEIGATVLPALTELVNLLTELTAVAIQVARSSEGMSRTLAALVGIDPSKLGEFFQGLPVAIARSIPFLREMDLLIRGIASVAKEFDPERIAKGKIDPRFLQPTGPAFGDVDSGTSKVEGEDKVGFFARQERLKQEQEAREKAAAAAQKQAEKIAELRAEFDKAAASAFNLSQATKDILFEADPSKATAAVLALQKAIEDIDAIPLGVTIDGKAALDALDKQIRAAVLALQVEVDPKKRSEVERVLEELRAKAANISTGLRQPSGDVPRFDVKNPEFDVSEEVDAIAAAVRAFNDLPPIDLITSDQADQLAEYNELLEQAGVNVEALTDRLIAAGTEAGTIIGTMVEADTIIGASLEQAFNPTLNLIGDLEGAVGDFAQSSSAEFSKFFDTLFTKGAFTFNTLHDFIFNLGVAVKNLILDLIAAIAKALVLRAIGSFLGFSGGGEVTKGVQSIASAAGGGEIVSTPRESQRPGTAAVRVVPYRSGGTVLDDEEEPQRRPRYGQGGVVHEAVRYVRALAAGGAVMAALASSGPATSVASTPVVSLAGGGLGTIPGANSNRDSVLAHLAPGEYVMTNRGGMNPTAVVEKNARLGEFVEASLGRGVGGSRGEAPVIGEVHIHAADWESWRNQSRPGGRLSDELERQLELGR